jgi:glycosyltransferase involved in cell wall biosynthesis
MPYAMRRSLNAQGCRIVSFVPSENRRRWHQAVRSRAAQFLPSPARKILKGLLRVPSPAISVQADDEEAYRWTRDEATRLSREIVNEVRQRGRECDVLFGCCISTLLCEMNAEIPIVYFSDTTTRIIFKSYPQYQSQGEGYRRACEELEQRAMSLASAVVFATDLARRSAIEDYGVPSDIAFTVPMGANVAGEEGRTEPAYADPPSRESLHLVITAADPERKRLGLAIDVVDELRRRGWMADLEAIGAPTPRALAHPHVRCLGYLSLRSAADRRRNHDALRRSHLMILPSLGEAFGIAPCEAALLGRPSIVSAAGGLPEVVLHGETGIVMGLESTAEDYARAIIDLVSNPDRYLAMSKAAEARARDRFTWEHWGEQLVKIMDRVRKNMR